MIVVSKCMSKVPVEAEAGQGGPQHDAETRLISLV